MTRHEQVHAARESVDEKECIVSRMKGAKSIYDRMHGADLALVLLRSKTVWCYIRRKRKERGEDSSKVQMCAGTKECSEMDGKLGDISVRQDNMKTSYEIMDLASKAAEQDKRSRIVERRPKGL